jgi:CIC family chloride channel protein
MKFFKQIIYLFLIPAVIGTLGGFAALIFRKLISISNLCFRVLSGNNHDYYVVFLPIIFLITYVLSRRFLIFPENVTIDEIAGRISAEKGGFNLKKSLFVLLLTSFNIGFGVPVGREGPIAKLGGVLSEIYLKLTKMNKLYFPMYLTCGVSSAISATFNAPVAAVLFGIEVVLGKVNSYVVIPLVVSSGTATLISRKFLGNFPAFYVPKLQYQDLEIPLLLIVAVASAVTSGLFLSILEFSKKFRLLYMRLWAKISFIFGFVVGILIFIYPEIAGVGYETITKLFQKGFSPDRALEIFLAKFFAVILSFVSGIFGGLLSPSVFMGSFLGYFVGKFSTADPRVFALVGSAAFLSGISRAPFRSSLIIIELTHSYQLVVPILLTSVTANYLVGISNEISFIRRSLLHKGIAGEFLEKKLENFKIEDFLEFIPPVYESSRVNYVLKRFLEENIRYIPVVKSPKDKTLIGIVSVRDLRLASIENPKKLLVKEIMTPEPFTLTLETPPEEILKVVALFEIGSVPVVDNRGEYVGMFNVSRFIRNLLIPSNLKHS